MRLNNAGRNALRRGSGLALSTLAIGAVALPTSPASAATQPSSSSSAAQDAVRAVLARTLPAGVAPAPTIESQTGRIGSTQVAAIKAAAVSDLNAQMVAKYGALPAAAARQMGSPTYLGSGDVQVYAVTQGGRAGYIAVPVNTAVSADGQVFFPTPDAEGGTGSFSGPWGSEVYNVFTAYATDEGGYWCGHTNGRLGTSLTARKLTDTSSTYDYYGLVLDGVADITSTQTQDCHDFVDWFSIGMRRSNSGGVFVAQDPKTDYTGSCVNDFTASVGVNYGAGTGSVSKTFARCDSYDVSGANTADATSWYSTAYDNGKTCDTSREAAQVAVIRVPAGASTNMSVGYGLTVGNYNYDVETCSCG